MADQHPMPSALQIAEAMAKILRAKIDVNGAETIVLSREEASLCLGLAEGAPKISPVWTIAAAEAPRLAATGQSS